MDSLNDPPSWYCTSPPSLYVYSHLAGLPTGSSRNSHHHRSTKCGSKTVAVSSPAMACTELKGELFKVWKNRTWKTNHFPRFGVTSCLVLDNSWPPDDGSSLSTCNLIDKVSVHLCHVSKTTVSFQQHRVNSLCFNNVPHRWLKGKVLQRKTGKVEYYAQNRNRRDQPRHLVCLPEHDLLLFTFHLEQYIRLASHWWSKFWCLENRETAGAKSRG